MAKHANMSLRTAGIVSVNKSPTVASVAPPTAPAAGGDAVVITGTGFKKSAAPSVTFDGVAATAVVVTSATTIACTTPAHAAGAVDVVVTNAAGGDGHNMTGTGAGAFTYT